MSEWANSEATTKRKLREKIIRLTKEHRELATLWGFVQEVQRVSKSPSSDAKSLAKVISSDAVIATKLLRTVSSQAYGLPSDIADLDQAIVLLGNKAVVDLCTSITALRCLSGENRGFDRAALWQHSLATGVVAQTLQSSLFDESAPELFTAGLLCNIGRICIDQFMPDEFDQILALSKEMPMLNAELRVLGASHAEIGAWIANDWHLSPRLCRVMEQHHGPSGLDKWAMAVNLAYVYADAMGVGSPGENRVASLAPGCLKVLGIDADKLKSLVPAMNEAIAAAEPMLAIMVEK